MELLEILKNKEIQFKQGLIYHNFITLFVLSIFYKRCLLFPPLFNYSLCRSQKASLTQFKIKYCIFIGALQSDWIFSIYAEKLTEIR
jgi:hypothetical protein